MIDAERVTKRFGRVTAVDGLSFRVEAGDALALWGSNGAGKTTLIRCLLGLLRFRGSMSVGGIDARRHGKRARRLIGYVPQELAFHDDMRLGDAMAFFGSLRAAPTAESRALLERVGLAGHERKRVRDLSGGMKQRFALGVALLGDPPVIVLDEPTSNLDALARGEVVEMLQGLKRDGKTILFASHRPDEVIALADRILVMERARLLREATPAELWPTEAGVRTVRLHVAAGREPDAAARLREAGHTVNLNGHGLCVAVARDRKALPIGVLAAARIEVRDFEILDDLRIGRERS